MKNKRKEASPLVPRSCRGRTMDDFQDDFGCASSHDADNTNEANLGGGILEKTIQLMEDKQLCVHPHHAHSFQMVNFMMVSLRKCAGCQGRLNAVIFGGGANSSNQVVKCVACGAFAHRNCALSNSVVWTASCPVNAPIAATADADAATTRGDHRESPQSTDDDGNDEEDDQVEVDPPQKVRTVDSLEDGSRSSEAQNEASMSSSSHDDNNANSNNVMVEPLDTSELTWTSEGPPQHWAAQGLENVIPSISVPTTSETEHEHNDDEDEDVVPVTRLHYANHPFASISRALQENVVAHFQRTRANCHAMDNSTRRQRNNADNETEGLSMQVDDTEINDESEPSLANDTIEAAKNTITLPRRIGVATVAGGIAGGVAGMALAGPAGAFAGYRFGQAAGALGVILEGSVSIGVFVASIATAGYTAKHVQEMNERRVITMGEEGASRKVLLVRPNIQIDPLWVRFVAEAKRNAPRGSGFPLFSDGKKTRYRRDSDIVTADEDEIPTHDKVLLLVSRLLNDKTSLPGFVYRRMIRKFQDRCKERENVVLQNESEASSPRARRDDAHAVIKHVTATLLEVRPGLGSSPRLTELTAVAVEGLVFGELYDDIFLEICTETKHQDENLTAKIADFKQREQPDSEMLSASALSALEMIPEAHSAVDKLQYCVEFLEKISIDDAGGGSVVTADSLLKLACQHLLVAKISDLNAQVGFLEEYARDEQLLKGREGYALVTLQASLHFLNMSRDFSRDIFEQDEAEENVPVHVP